MASHIKILIPILPMRSTMMSYRSSSDGSRASASPSLPRHRHVRERRRRDEAGFNGKTQDWPSDPRSSRQMSADVGRNGLHSRESRLAAIPRRKTRFCRRRRRRDYVADHLQTDGHLAKRHQTCLIAEINDSLLIVFSGIFWGFLRILKGYVKVARPKKSPRWRTREGASGRSKI